jgi:hypothetical protein
VGGPLADRAVRRRVAIRRPARRGESRQAPGAGRKQTPAWSMTVASPGSLHVLARCDAATPRGNGQRPRAMCRACIVDGRLRGTVTLDGGGAVVSPPDPPGETFARQTSAAPAPRRSRQPTASCTCGRCCTRSAARTCTRSSSNRAGSFASVGAQPVRFDRAGSG